MSKMTGDTLLSDDQLSDNQPVQKTLDGMFLSPLPKVRTTDGFIVNWDRNIIVNQLLKETKLSEIFYNKPAITKEEAFDIAKEAERIIRRMSAKFLSGPLIREIVNTILLERGHLEWRNIMTRVGASVYDAYEIDTGYGLRQTTTPTSSIMPKPPTRKKPTRCPRNRTSCSCQRTLPTCT